MIQEEDITIVNIHSLIIEAPKILTDIKREIDSNTIIIGDFNTPFTTKDRLSRQDINEKPLALKLKLVYCIGLIFLAYFTLYNGLQFHPSH